MSTLHRVENFVRFVPVNAEFTMLECAHQQSIITGVRLTIFTRANQITARPGRLRARLCHALLVDSGDQHE